ncbi:MAG: cobalt-precorrin 5A hydrolase [Saccharolobus sp.]|uniref:cobalt-precorrin 5A hydrolase n=1 Tax=Saccharolobus sp. TaxID=2100761 RepID=UPI0028CE9594|nr:cobalt-precorrin 5A hydrolase [Saccharolobus sp.]MDT7862348.1 cobalt-precorrin 5A hydrolase [Saccharolobus sp.]
MIENLWKGIALISASEDGYKAGEIIKEKLRNLEIPVVHYRYQEAKIEDIWKCYDAVIFIMALEGATRIVCKYAKAKNEDPPVICIDDKINYVIPLIGGHWGANEIAKELAQMFNATAIITTAAELKGKLSVEKIAGILISKIINPESIVRINSALLRDEIVCITGADKIPSLSQNNIKFNSEDCKYIITLDYNKEYDSNKIIVKLKPLKLAIGIGSKKEVNLSEIREGIYKILERLNVDINRVGVIASIREEVKKLAEELNVKFRLISENEINNFANPCLTPPSKTLSELGLKGVAEVSALIAGGKTSKLILRKIPLSKSITIAVASYEEE